MVAVEVAVDPHLLQPARAEEEEEEETLLPFLLTKTLSTNI